MSTAAASPDRVASRRAPGPVAADVAHDHVMRAQQERYERAYVRVRRSIWLPLALGATACAAWAVNGFARFQVGVGMWALWTAAGLLHHRQLHAAVARAGQALGVLALGGVMWLTEVARDGDLTLFWVGLAGWVVLAGTYARLLAARAAAHRVFARHNGLVVRRWRREARQADTMAATADRLAADRRAAAAAARPGLVVWVDDTLDLA